MAPAYLILSREAQWGSGKGGGKGVPSSTSEKEPPQRKSTTFRDESRNGAVGTRVGE